MVPRTLQHKKLSIIATAYNEEKNLRELFRRVAAVTETITELDDWELVVVDNGSHDQTLTVLKDLHDKDAHLRYVSLSRNFGNQGGLLAALDHADGDLVVMIDADLQHPPEVIPDMIEHWQNHYDIIFTIKSFSNQGFVRRCVDRLYYAFYQKLTGVELKGHSDFRLIDKAVANALRSLKEKNKFIRGLTAWVGFKSIGISYQVADRFSGETKYRFGDLAKLAVDGVLSFSILPLRLATFFGMALAGLSVTAVLTLLVLMVMKLWSDDNVSLLFAWGFCGFGFLSGIQLICTGLLGEYVYRIFDEVKRRPNYIVTECSVNKVNMTI